MGRLNQTAGGIHLTSKCLGLRFVPPRWKLPSAMSPSSRSSLCVVLAYEPLDSFYTTSRARKAAAQGPERVAGSVRRAGATSAVANDRESDVPGDGASLEA